MKHLRKSSLKDFEFNALAIPCLSSVENSALSTNCPSVDPVGSLAPRTEKPHPAKTAASEMAPADNTVRRPNCLALDSGNSSLFKWGSNSSRYHHRVLEARALTEERPGSSQMSPHLETRTIAQRTRMWRFAPLRAAVKLPVRRPAVLAEGHRAQGPFRQASEQCHAPAAGSTDYTAPQASPSSLCSGLATSWCLRATRSPPPKHH